MAVGHSTGCNLLTAAAGWYLQGRHFIGLVDGVQAGQVWEKSIIRDVLDWESREFHSSLGSASTS